MKTFERVENEEIGRYTPNGGVILTVLNSIALWKKRMTIEKKRNVKGSFARRCLCLLTESHRSGNKGDAVRLKKFYHCVDPPDPLSPIRLFRSRVFMFLFNNFSMC